MLDEEEWRPIEGWPYEVSSHGRARRSANGCFNTYVGRIMALSVGHYGYRHIIMYSEGRRKLAKIHILVCTAFHGPKPFPSACALHKDDDVTNMHKDNLYWGTKAENMADAYRNKTRRQRERALGKSA